MESVALRAAMVMPILMLQKPHARSKSWEHVKCLERRLIDWKEGNIDTLLHEGRTIQSRFRTTSSPSNSDEQHTSQQFVKFMKQGKLRAALRLLEQNRGSGVLSLNSTLQVGPMQ